VVPLTGPSPSARKLVAALLIVSFIVLWAALVASLARFIGSWPILVQAPFYLVMGIIWIFPLKPLVRWSQTGAWRAHKDA
jgi:hypothetical protein